MLCQYQEIYSVGRGLLVVGNRTRYTVGEENSLTIRNLQKEDGGEYICRAFNRVGEPAYEYLTLTIHGT